MILKPDVRRCLALLLGLGPILMMTGLNAEAADAAEGKRLALQWCAACHLVANDQNRANSASLPSFYDISASQGYEEETLKDFLADPHPKMPNMSLSNTEIADIARYISSLTN